MAISLDPKNLVFFIAAISPIIIISFILLNSLSNGNMKGIIYLFCLLISVSVGLLAKKTMCQKDINGKCASNASKLYTKGPLCNIFQSPWLNEFDNMSAPSMRALFHMFTFTYFALGLTVNPIKEGMIFCSFLLFLMLIDLELRRRQKCDTIVDSAYGYILGFTSGLFLWGAVYFGFPGPKYTYYTHIDSGKKCRLNNEEVVQWKCTYD